MKPKGLHALMAIGHVVTTLLTIPSIIAFYVAPTGGSIMGFAGLVAPVFVLLHGGFLLYWMTQLKAWAFLSVLVLVVMYPQYKGVITFHGEGNESPLWRIATWNVHGWRNATWTQLNSTQEGMFSCLENADPLLIALQEHRTELSPRLKTIWPYALEEEGGYGLAFFSKKPYGRHGFYTFSESHPGHRGFLWADAALPAGDTVRLINVHLITTSLVPEKYTTLSPIDSTASHQWIKDGRDIAYRLARSGYIRARQMGEVIAFAQRSKHPVVLLGDFNDTPTSFVYGESSRLAEDAFLQAGKGFGNSYAKLALLPLRIDHVFAEKPWVAVKYTTFKQRWSDHHPIFVDYGIEGDSL